MPTVSGGTNLLDATGILERFGIAQGMHVADFGCGGAGHFVFPTARLVGEKGLVYAVDILEPVLSAITSKARSDGFTNIKTVQSNIEVVGATKIPDASLDAVLIINLLFQNTKYADILREAARLLKPQTRILVIEWKPSGGTVFAPPPDQRVSQLTVKQAAQTAGLEFQEEFQAGVYHYGLILSKA